MVTVAIPYYLLLSNCIYLVGKGLSYLLALKFPLGIANLASYALNTKWIHGLLPSSVICHSAASVTRGSQMKELVHLVQLYK